MNKQLFKDAKPIIDFIYGLLKEIEILDKALADAQEFATKLRKDSDEMHLKVNELKKDNHAMQMFIEEHVDEDKKKLIFNMSDSE